MLRIAIIVIVLSHGVGHSLGLLPVFGLASGAGWSDSSWLLDGPLGSLARYIGGLLWLLALVGFVACGLGLLGWVVPADWSIPLGVAASLLSLLALALFPQAFPSPANVMGAIAVDLAVLSTVGAGWATVERLGL